MIIQLPQIKLIPTEQGFARGSRMVEFELKTSNSDFGTVGVDNAWLKKQADFFMKLDNDDLYTVISYTTRSHQWITPFMRSGKIPGKQELKNIVQDDLLAPLYPQITRLSDRGVKVFGTRRLSLEMFKDTEHRDYVRQLFIDKKTPVNTRYVAFQMLLRGNDFSDRTLRMALTTYVRDLKKIMKSSPKTASDMVVFRGQLDTYIRKDAKATTIKEFLSTTFDLNYALAYSTNIKNKTKGRIVKVLVPKGSGCLALCIVNPFDDVGEFEILLPPNKFGIISTGVPRTVGDRKLPTNTWKMKK